MSGNERLIQDLEDQIAAMKDAIRWVVTQQADDLCWMDAYVRLGKFVGVEITLEQLKMLPKGKMLTNCDHYITCLQNGIDYKAEGLAEENERLRKELAHYKQLVENAERSSDGGSG